MKSAFLEEERSSFRVRTGSDLQYLVDSLMSLANDAMDCSGHPSPPPLIFPFPRLPEESLGGESCVEEVRPSR